MSDDAPQQVCPTCGAAMVPGQDWCLECGSAAPGRLGGRAGWRAVGTITGLTAVLVAGAAAAGYAAITDPAPSGGAGPPVAQAPTTPTTPVTPAPVPAPPAPGATTPGTETTPTIPTPSPPNEQPTKPAPTTPAPNPPSPSPSPSRSPAPAPAPTPTPPPTPPKPAAIHLGSDAVSTYDPYKRPGAEIGKARWAVDGKDDTVWDVVVPADGEPIGVGLLIDLGSAQTISSIQFQTPTAGFRVEVYTARNKAPKAVTSKAWHHVADVPAAKGSQSITLAGAKGQNVRHVLLWITAPGRPEDPRASISELTVRKG
jgi:hypothetical protein